MHWGCPACIGDVLHALGMSILIAHFHLRLRNLTDLYWWYPQHMTMVQQALTLLTRLRLGGITPLHQAEHMLMVAEITTGSRKVLQNVSAAMKFRC